MNAPATLVRAVNQEGFNVERLTGAGWQAVVRPPFENRAQAQRYMDHICKLPGDEYRVYAALT